MMGVGVDSQGRVLARLRSLNHKLCVQRDSTSITQVESDRGRQLPSKSNLYMNVHAYIHITGKGIYAHACIPSTHIYSKGRKEGRQKKRRKEGRDGGKEENISNKNQGKENNQASKRK